MKSYDNDLSIYAVKSIKHALIVRKIRNTCFQYLTGDPKRISLPRQLIWYVFSYRRQLREKKYRLYLFKNKSDVSIGYGALKLSENCLHVTECVSEGQRGRGYGRTILKSMIEISKRESRPLIAEIWSDNDRSITLHERNGFKCVENKLVKHQELKIFKHNSFSECI